MLINRRKQKDPKFCVTCPNAAGSIFLTLSLSLFLSFDQFCYGTTDVLARSRINHMRIRALVKPERERKRDLEQFATKWKHSTTNISRATHPRQPVRIGSGALIVDRTELMTPPRFAWHGGKLIGVSSSWSVKRALNCHLQLSLNREPLKIRLLKIDTQHTFVSARPSTRHCVCRESGGIFGKNPIRPAAASYVSNARARARARVPRSSALERRPSLTRAMDFYSPDILIRRLNRAGKPTRRLWSKAAASPRPGP